MSKSARFFQAFIKEIIPTLTFGLLDLLKLLRSFLLGFIKACKKGWRGLTEFFKHLKSNKNLDDLELKLFREGLEGIEKASIKLIKSISKKRTVQIAKEGTDDMKYLEWMNAVANVGGKDLTHILLKPNPSKAAIIEEFLHGTQKRIKIIQSSSDIAYAEYHVKDFMIRHKRILGLSNEDVEILELLRDRDYKIWKNI